MKEKFIEQYRNKGFRVIPCDGKKPKYNDWQKSNLSLNDLLQIIRYENCNIGIICGSQSNHLIDVDIDSDLALITSKYFLPSTGMISGHASNPNSHRWYLCEGMTYTKLNGVNGCLVEIRSGNDHQTLVPPSIHPDTNEPYEWNTEELEPATVNAQDLLRAVKFTAASALLSEHWKPGFRHDLALYLAGAFLSHSRPIEEAETFIKAICDAAKDFEVTDRIKDVRDTYSQSGKRIAGTGKLKDLLPLNVYAKISDWLEWTTQREETATDLMMSVKSFRELKQMKISDDKWTFKNQIRKNTISALIGDGGVGKSMLLMELAISAALGRKLITGFEPVKPMKVLALFGEDDAGTIQERNEAFIEAFHLTNEDIHLLDDNYLICDEHATPLVEIGTHNSLKTTDAFRTFQNRIQAFKPDLIILDPKSAWVSMEENSNSHTRDFLRYITQAISLSEGCSIIISHHTGKQAFGLSQSSARGASDFANGCRCVIGLQRNKENVIVEVLKNNYGNRGEITRLSRDHNGVLYETQLDIIQKALINYVQDHELPKRDIDAGVGCFNDVKHFILNATGIQTTKKTLKEAIDTMLETGALIEEKDGKKLFLRLS